MLNQEKFEEAKRRALLELSGDGGIGTLSEKLIHKTLKNYFEPDTDNHEVAYLGSVADIKNADGITEIQTRAFRNLLPKLRRFLENDKVTVVYPIIRTKTVQWINKETGDVTAPHKTTREGRETDVLYEMSALSELALHENLTVRLVMLRAEEYKYLDGWDKSRKRGATKGECIPTAIEKTVDLRDTRDYINILPPLPERFGSKELSRALKLRGRRASYSLAFLRCIGAITQVDKRGSAFVYSISK